MTAQLLFSTASLLTRMFNNGFGGRREDFDVVREYEYLFTKEEIQAIRRERLIAQMEGLSHESNIRTRGKADS